MQSVAAPLSGRPWEAEKASVTAAGRRVRAFGAKGAFTM